MPQTPHPAPTAQLDADIAVTLLIPAFNEEDNVKPLVEEIAQTLDPGLAYEILFVDDASTDGTVAAVRALMADPPAGPARLRLLRHERQCGKSTALLSGAEAARGRLLVLMDGDLQNDPRDVAALLAAFEAGGGLGRVGVVQGQRRRRRDTMFKRLSSRTANHVRRTLLNDRTVDTGCGLKLVPRDLYLTLPRFEGMHRFTPALVGRTGLSVELAAVNDRPRAAGVSKYGLWNRLWVGIGDMLMVWWLIRRYRRPGAVTEID